MKKIFFLIILFVLLSPFVYSGWFGFDSPPPIYINDSYVRWNPVNPWLYGIGDTLYFNESYLNDTISSISPVTSTLEFHRYIQYGSNLSGTSGTSGRILIINNTNLSSNEFIVIDNYKLLDTDYTITHNSINSQITFLNKIWDDQRIQVDYYTESTISSTTITENYFGTSADGSDGQSNRNLILSNNVLSKNELIIVDNYVLISGSDYTINHQISGSTITFLNKLWDDQRINVRYMTE